MPIVVMKKYNLAISIYMISSLEQGKCNLNLMQ